MKLDLQKIEVDPTVQIRRINHEDTIKRYEESFDKLPPIDVFETPDGILLADGFHRMAAAERLGLSEIEVKVHKGSREEALEHAVIANTKNADPLTPEERDDGIRRLKQLHPERSHRQIAKAMSVSHLTVKRVFDVDEVKRSVVSPVTRVTDSHYREIAGAEPKNWEPLVKAADQRGWTRDVTAQAVQNLRDDRIPDRQKRDILKGEADPVVVTPDGQFAVPSEIVGKQLREMASNDAVLAMEHYLRGLLGSACFGQKSSSEQSGNPGLIVWCGRYRVTWLSYRSFLTKPPLRKSRKLFREPILF